jgi:hypothetical protein
MRFLRQYQYVLCFLGVVVFSLVMVFRQYMADQSAHVERREDFLLLHERGRRDACERLYQRLIQELPEMSDRNLANDLDRTALALGARTNEIQDLLWKYHVSVGNELRHRAEHRVARSLQEAQQ